MCEQEKLKLCRILAHSVYRLHENGIVHGDLKPENSLLKRLESGAVTAKLIDFDNCFWESEVLPANKEIHGDRSDSAAEIPGSVSTLITVSRF